MANEAVIIEKPQMDGLNFTVADGPGIEKGAICFLVDERNASGANTVAGAPCAGIAMAEKVAGDGSTTLSFARDGIYDLKASGAIALGNPLMMAGHDNMVRFAATTASGAQIIGSSLATASANEVFAARILF